jgi:hypothetical protein
MKKSTLFISTALTIFTLAVMFGVVSAYQQGAINVAAPATAEAVGTAATVEAVPTLNTIVSPDQAASIAAQFLGDTGVYGVEVVDYQGVPAFLVTFSSGKLIYVGSTGEIIAISQVQPVVVVAPPAKKNKNNGGNSNPVSVSNNGEHDSDNGSD